MYQYFFMAIILCLQTTILDAHKICIKRGKRNQHVRKLQSFFSFSFEEWWWNLALTRHLFQICGHILILTSEIIASGPQFKRPKLKKCFNLPFFAVPKSPSSTFSFFVSLFGISTNFRVAKRFFFVILSFYLYPFAMRVFTTSQYNNFIYLISIIKQRSRIKNDKCIVLNEVSWVSLWSMD